MRGGGGGENEKGNGQVIVPWKYFRLTSSQRQMSWEI